MLRRSGRLRRRAVCTILILNHVVRDCPQVIAANRDELYARDASRPGVIASETGAQPVIVGGTDRKSGGSWLGVNGAGLLVGLTNQRSLEPPNPNLRSRGEVVVEALRCRSLDEVRDCLAQLDARDFNTFNLIFGDGRDLEVAYARREDRQLRTEQVPRGVHVLPNDVLDSSEFPKVRRAKELLGEVSDLSWPELRSHLARCLSDHRQPPAGSVDDSPMRSRFSRSVLLALQALCIHTPLYGTRSATIAALEPDHVRSYLFADGPPCTAPFEEMTALLQ
jgi:uncharacterized protein with NRDE domain